MSLLFHAAPSFVRYSKVMEQMMTNRSYEVTQGNPVHVQIAANGTAELIGERVGRVRIICFDPAAVETMKIDKVKELLSSLREIPQEKRPEHLILVVETKLSSKAAQTLHESSFRIEVFYYAEISFNLVDHQDVPYHRLLTKRECKNLISQRCASKRRQAVYGDNHCIPRCTKTTCFCVSYLNVNDPVSRYYYFRPNDMVLIMEPSETSGWTPTYSVVISDASIQ
jgi:DNA-directed RNA polymerase subunit H (RpoH/RPB5)